MRRTILSFAVSYLFMFHAPAQDSVSVSDFRYPETRAVDLKLNGDAAVEGGSSDGHYNSAPFMVTHNEGSNVNVNVGTNFLYFHTKDDHDINLTLNARGRYSGFGRSYDEIDTSGRKYSEYSSRNWSSGLDGGLQYRHFLTPDGISVMTAISADYSSYYDKSDDGTGSVDIEKGFSVNFRGAAGVGFGHLRDGTVVFRALRIIERLRDDGVLQRTLTRDEMLAIIDRVARQGEYTTNFSRYQKYFIGDIVKALHAIGAIKDESLAAFETLRIQEAFSESIYSRMFGWNATYQFVDRHNQVSRDYYGRHSIDNDWEYANAFGIQAGIPLSIRTHLYGEARLEIPSADFPIYYDFVSRVTLTYQLAERISSDISYQANVNYGYDTYSIVMNVVDPVKYWYHEIHGNFIYFIEDAVSLRVGADYTWQGATGTRLGAGYPPFQGTPYRASRGFSCSFGLSFNVI